MAASRIHGFFWNQGDFKQRIASLKLNSCHLKMGHSERKQSSPKHPFSVSFVIRVSKWTINPDVCACSKLDFFRCILTLDQLLGFEDGFFFWNSRPYMRWPKNWRVTPGLLRDVWGGQKLEVCIFVFLISIRDVIEIFFGGQTQTYILAKLS